MRQQDHLAALAGDFSDRGGNALEAGQVGDAAIFGWHVEIDAQQHALAFHVDVIEGAEFFGHLRFSCGPSFETPRSARLLRMTSVPHGEERASSRVSNHEAINQSFLPIATAVSAMRLEKPHSLSYHDITRTSVPFCTLVWSMCRVEECGSWLKSIETLASLV